MTPPRCLARGEVPARSGPTRIVRCDRPKGHEGACRWNGRTIVDLDRSGADGLERRA